MDVALLRWPAEPERRERLRLAGVARLLLVDSEAPAPVATDQLEDWVRLPADDEDVRARITALVARADSTGARTPRIDAEGILRCGGESVVLPPVEARLVGALVERLGTVVSRDALTRVGWPESEAPGRNALDVRVLRIRRRIQPLGLVLRTVRSRGYLLDLAPLDQ